LPLGFTEGLVCCQDVVVNVYREVYNITKESSCICPNQSMSRIGSLAMNVDSGLSFDSFDMNGQLDGLEKQNDDRFNDICREPTYVDTCSQMSSSFNSSSNAFNNNNNIGRNFSQNSDSRDSNQLTNVDAYSQGSNESSSTCSNNTKSGLNFDIKDPRNRSK